MGESPVPIAAERAERSIRILKAQETKKKGKDLFIRIAVIAFGIYLLYSLIATQANIMDKKQELDTLRKEYNEHLIRNEELQKTLDSYGTDSFIEQQARDYGYASPDEFFYIDISGSH